LFFALFLGNPPGVVGRVTSSDFGFGFEIVTVGSSSEFPPITFSFSTGTDSFFPGAFSFGGVDIYGPVSSSDEVSPILGFDFVFAGGGTNLAAGSLSDESPIVVTVFGFDFTGIGFDFVFGGIGLDLGSSSESSPKIKVDFCFGRDSFYGVSASESPRNLVSIYLGGESFFGVSTPSESSISSTILYTGGDLL
jgi:hypothetical protein